MINQFLLLLGFAFFNIAFASPQGADSLLLAEGQEDSSLVVAMDYHHGTLAQETRKSYDLSFHTPEWDLSSGQIKTTMGLQEEVRYLSPRLHLDPRKSAGGIANHWKAKEHIWDTQSLNPYREALEKLEVARLDTPWMGVEYQRTAFTGSAFQMDFQRLLIGPLQVGIRMQSRSTDSTAEWEYQPSVHQPYLSLSRDSSSLPFSGRNLAFERSLFTPWIAYHTPNTHLELYTTQIENAESRPYLSFTEVDTSAVQRKPLFITDPYQVSEDTDEWGIRWLQKYGTHTWDLTYYSFENTLEKTNLHRHRFLDSSYYYLFPLHQIWRYETEGLRGSWKEENWGTEVEVETEREILSQVDSLDKEYLDQFPHLDSDRSRIQLNQTIGFKKWQLTPRVAYLRYSSPLDRLYHDFAYGFHSELQFGDFSANLQGEKSKFYPFAEDLYFKRFGEHQAPNSELLPEIRNEFSAKASYQTLMRFDLGLNYVHREDALEESSQLQKYLVSGDSLWADSAFVKSNVDLAETLWWSLGFEGSWGHWNWGAWHYRKIYDRRTHEGNEWDNPTTTGSEYKGYVQWKKALLTKKNLGLSLRWDWNWHGSRYAWSHVVNKNEAYVVRLPYFFVFDYEVKIKVQSFQLYLQIANLNHDQYHFEPGYTPTGANFRWGIIWGFNK